MNQVLQQSLRGIHKLLTNSNERKFYWLSIKYGAAKRYKPVRIKFLKFRFELPDVLSFLWQFKEIFVEEFYRFETSSEQPVIYDCGANVGTSCAYFKYRYKDSRVIAFEPNPNIVEYLKRNIRNNSMDNIQVIEKAVWINNDGIELGTEEADGSSIYLDQNKTQVASVRLKDLLEQEKKVDMLKIDIEGAEVEVLKDCRNSLDNVQNIFVEFHSYKNEKQHLSDLIAVLEAAGFRYYILQPENRSKPFLNRYNKSNPQMDLQLNIFACK